jgi:transposase
MKRRVNARFSTLEHLFGRAEESARYHKTEAEVELLVERLKALWADYIRLTARRKALRAQIEAIGRELVAKGELPELSHLKGITLFNLTRLASQTGPLTDFGSGRALLRYAGLNLRERQSGTYRGQTRLSKKGRPLLRKILGQTIFPVLRKAMLYGPYYHRKLEEGMIRAKAKVAVMRKFLCMLHAWPAQEKPSTPIASERARVNIPLPSNQSTQSKPDFSRYRPSITESPMTDPRPG